MNNKTYELDADAPDYLAYIILAATQDLKNLAPDHILVKAVEKTGLLNNNDNPDQTELFI